MCLGRILEGANGAEARGGEAKRSRGSWERKSCVGRCFATAPLLLAARSRDCGIKQLRPKWTRAPMAGGVASNQGWRGRKKLHGEKIPAAKARATQRRNENSRRRKEAAAGTGGAGDLSGPTKYDPSSAQQQSLCAPWPARPVRFVKSPPWVAS